MYGGQWETAWGKKNCGVTKIFSCELAFAALKENGDVVIWGGHSILKTKCVEIKGKHIKRIINVGHGLIVVPTNIKKKMTDEDDKKESFGLIHWGSTLSRNYDGLAKFKQEMIGAKVIKKNLSELVHVQQFKTDRSEEIKFTHEVEAIVDKWMKVLGEDIWGSDGFLKDDYKNNCRVILVNLVPKAN
eukprot:UN26549